ncbi:MAG: ATP-binding cassette domain-containing protein [Verrucomicrobiota bacterium]
MTDPLFQIRDLTVHSGPRPLLQSVDLDIPGEGGVFGFVGPSGAGKSTLLKSLNRLLELTPGLTIGGGVKFQGGDIYARSLNPDALRARIGMLFQQPVIFPAGILANVLFGIRRLGTVPRKALAETAERALRDAAIWDEVKDRLRESALRLSTGQQQRLCLARTLACQPEVILMDEPTSALDPRSSAAIEELIEKLKVRQPIVLVTHNLPQARRLCGSLALLCAGRLVMTGPASQVLDAPELESCLTPSLC